MPYCPICRDTTLTNICSSCGSCLSSELSSEISEKRKVQAEIKQIGYGLDSKIVTPRIKREDVKIDANTKRKTKYANRSILYAAGYSLDDE